MILVVMALPQESQNRMKDLEVLYTGIGKVNAAFALTKALSENPKVERVLNLGTAGSQKFKTHAMIECSGFVQRDMDLSPLNFPVGETPLDPIPGALKTQLVLPQYQNGVCGTGDSFETGRTKVACDLVDMEAYALAKVCAKMGLPFHSFKYITDGSDENAHKDWVENLKPASIALRQVYEEFLKHFKLTPH